MKFQEKKQLLSFMLLMLMLFTSLNQVDACGGNQDYVAKSDSAGNLIIVWAENDKEVSEIKCRVKSVQGDWESIQTISNPSDPSFSPKIAIGPNGMIMILWVSFIQDRTESCLVASISLDSGKNWQDPDILSENSPTADSYGGQITDSGDITVVWSSVVISHDQMLKMIYSIQKLNGNPWGKVAVVNDFS